MIGSLLLFVTGFPCLFSHPQNSDVVVYNLLEEQSISGIYLVLSGEGELIQLDLESPIGPGETALISFPWGFVNRVVFTTDMNGHYLVRGFPASSNPDTIQVSLAQKEFGGIFDRIYGREPIVVMNETLVTIKSISMEAPSMTVENALDGQIMLPGDVLRLWVENHEPVVLTPCDIEGNPGAEITLVSNPDTVYSFTGSQFFGNGLLHTTPAAEYSLTAANCMSSEQIVSLEVFDESGFSIGYFDFSSSPLETWDRALLHTSFPPSFVSCTDEHGRTYTLEEPDSITGYFAFDLLALDFNFSFPEGR